MWNFSENILISIGFLQVHGNVCLASVVVTQNLDWKLHAFDVLSEFDGHNEAATGQPLLVINLFHYNRMHFFFLIFL